MVDQAPRTFYGTPGKLRFDGSASWNPASWEGVDAELRQAIEEAARDYPGGVTVTAGKERHRTSRGLTPNHPGGYAADIGLYTKEGKKLARYGGYDKPGSIKAARDYGAWAKLVHDKLEAINPDKASRLRSGAYFGQGESELDNEHVDITPQFRGQTALGSVLGGFRPGNPWGLPTGVKDLPAPPEAYKIQGGMLGPPMSDFRSMPSLSEFRPSPPGAWSGTNTAPAPAPDPGFFSLGGFLPQKPADLTLHQPPQPSYDPLSSMHPPSIDVARDLMRGITPPASVPAPDTTPLAPAMSSLYGQGSMVNLHAPWSVEGAKQPPAVTRMAQPTMHGAAGYGLGVGAHAARSLDADPFSNPKPLQAEAGAYSPPSLPGWTVHETPRAFSPPGHQHSMAALSGVTTSPNQDPFSGSAWKSALHPMENPFSGVTTTGTGSLGAGLGASGLGAVSPRPAVQSTATLGAGLGASAERRLSFAKPQATRSIPNVPATPAPSTPLPKNMAEAMPSWASLATAAATSAVPGLGMLAAMPATAALAQKALAAIPGLPQQAPAVAPPVTQPVVAPRPPKPVPVSLPAPRPRPTLSPDPSLSGWGTMAAANNPFQAAGLSLLGQSALGKPMYGGGYINGVQQVFSGNRPSNAFGGLGYGNPFSGLAGLFSGGVQRAQAVPSQVGSFLGGLFGGGGPGNAGGGGGFGGGFGGGTFGGGGYGGGPGSPGHRDSSH